MSKEPSDSRFSQFFLLSLFYADCCALLDCLRQNSMPTATQENAMVTHPVTVTKLEALVSQEIYPLLKEALADNGALMRQVAGHKERLDDLFVAWSNGLLSTQQSQEIGKLSLKFGWLSTIYANQG